MTSSLESVSSLTCIRYISAFADELEAGYCYNIENIVGVFKLVKIDKAGKVGARNMRKRRGISRRTSNIKAEENPS